MYKSDVCCRNGGACSADGDRCAYFQADLRCTIAPLVGKLVQCVVCEVARECGP